MAEARAERRDSGFVPRDAGAVSERALSVVAPVCDDISVRIEGVRTLAQQLCRRDADRATGEQIGALAAAILGARALRDPAHPRAQQLAELLGLLERRMRAMLAATPSANETSANDRVVAAEVMPPPTAQVREPWRAGRSTPAGPGTSVPASAVSRSSADLLKELNALEALARAAGAAAPADVAANDAAPPNGPASRSAVTPERQAAAEVLDRPQAQLPSTAERQASRAAVVAPAGAHAPVAATDPLAELMALSEAERLALFS